MSETSPVLKYRPSDKHKPGCAGGGPPRWFPSSASRCPDDVSLEEAAALLRDSVEARDDAHPNARARIALDSHGRFFKAYSEDDGTTWHGYPVRRELVARQVPTRVLREFCRRHQLTEADYRKLLGGAR
jgi:hypothetical protein